MQTQLPEASVEAQNVSLQLCSHLHQSIQNQGGSISFAQYMHDALYTPHMGYYTGGSHKLGQDGDFTTAPQMTYLFGFTLANQIAELLPQTSGIIYEFGAGTGKLAKDILTQLKNLQQLPNRYVIIDVSADLINRQKQLLNETHPDLIHLIEWASTLPEQFDGILIGNEVLDAMPCHLVKYEHQQLHELCVASDDSNQTPTFTWQLKPIENPTLLACAQALIPPIESYSSEISLSNRAFMSLIASKLNRGAIILIDYGFPEKEYYHAQRSMGTLIGHYRHHTIQDPFFMPGLMDLTCHVDFTAIAQTGIDAGLDLIGYTTQAQFLINAGLSEQLAQLNPDNHLHYLPHASAVQKLISPAEMGELFKVIAFGKNIDIDWIGFTEGDRCYSL